MRVVGRAIGEDEQPVAGATVRLEPGPHTTTSGVDGAFVIDDLAPHTYAVTARKDSHYAWHTLVGVDRAHEPVTLRLQQGTSARVHVFGVHGPVTGATLVLEHGFRTKTDADGCATVEGLAPIDHHGLIIREGWADQRVSLFPADDPGGMVEQSIDVQRGARIEGSVVDSNGAPVDGAVLTAWDTPRRAAPYEAWSGPDGRWCLRVQAGTYRLVARSKTRGAAQVIVTCDGRTVQRGLRLRLRTRRSAIATVVNAARGVLGTAARTRVAGVVVDVRGCPVPRAEVRVLKREPVRTDSHGRFEIDVLEPGEYEIMADVVGPWHTPRGHVARRRVTAGDTSIELVLPTLGVVVGRTLLDGMPLPYFGLRLVGPREFPYGGQGLGVRAADGRFVLPHVHPGTWQIALVAPGCRLATSEPFTITRDERVDVGDIALARGRRLSGHVRDDSGVAVAGARVRVGGMWASAEDRSPLERLFSTHYETVTDDSGAYAFDGLDLHRHSMRSMEVASAHARGRASLFQRVPTIEDAPLDFVLLGTGRIEGTVRNLHGGARHIEAVHRDEPIPRLASCDEGGGFVFDHMPAGDYELRVIAPESEQGSRVSVTVSANQTAVATVAMTGTSVELTIRVPPGRGRDLVIEPATEGAGVGERARMICVMDAEEMCTFCHVRPGGYRISLDKTEWRRITVDDSPGRQTIDLRRS